MREAIDDYSDVVPIPPQPEVLLADKMRSTASYIGQLASRGVAGYVGGKLGIAISENLFDSQVYDYDFYEAGMSVGTALTIGTVTASMLRAHLSYFTDRYYSE